MAAAKKSKKRKKVVEPSIDETALRDATVDDNMQSESIGAEDEHYESVEGWDLSVDPDLVAEDETSSGRAEFIEGMGSFIGGVKTLSSSALKLARDRTLDSAARMIQQSPDQLERMAKAGRSLQDLRQVAGVSVEELASAIDLKNPDLLEAVEEGNAALPYEILLRLSSFYARNNPLPFILKYARTYSPLVSRTLEKVGIDKLVIEAEREIQFVQILRSRDASRRLSDEDFARVLAFTEKAFDMALNFADEAESSDIDEDE